MRKKETVKISKKIISIPPNYFFFCIILSIICYFLFPGLNLVNFSYNLITGIPIILFGIYLILNPHFLLTGGGKSQHLT